MNKTNFKQLGGVLVVLVPRARDNLGIAKWTPSHQLA